MVKQASDRSGVAPRLPHPVPRLAHRKLERSADGEEVERRYVKYSSTIDPTLLPAEWHQYLHRARPEPPSQDDIRRGQHQRELFRQRVAALEAEDAARRFQEQTGGGGGDGGFVQQLPEGEASQPR